MLPAGKSAFVALLLALTGAAQAQDYPSRPVKVVVPFVAGGGLDGIARVVTAKLQEELKQPFVIENRAGGAGNVGTAAVAKSPADGYTILMTTIGHTIAPSLSTNLRYDSIKDFQPLTLLGETSIVLVVDPKLPIRNVQELVAWAKANPSSANYGSSGVGNPLHLSMEMLMRATGTKFVMVPFTNDAQILTAITQGQLQAAMTPYSISRGQMEAGTIRAIAVTGAKRWPPLPDMPTVAEQGVPGYRSDSWHGMMLPAGTPKDIVEKLYSTIKRLMDSDEDMKKRYSVFGAIPVVNRPEEFAKRIEDEIAYFKKLTAEIGLKPKDD